MNVNKTGFSEFSSVQRFTPPTLYNQAAQKEPLFDRVMLRPGVIAFFSYFGIKTLAGKLTAPLCNKALDALTEPNKMYPETDIYKMIRSMKAKYKLFDVKITYVDEGNRENAYRAFVDRIKKKTSLPPVGIKRAFKEVANGNNAFYHPLLNEVVTSKKLPLTILHEMGHASNYSKFKLPKMIGRALGPILLIESTFNLALQRKMTAALVNSKKNNPELGAIFDKSIKITEQDVKIFEHLKDHIGLYYALGSIPLLLDEGLASYKGIQGVKGLLTQDKLSKFKKSLGLAFATYAAATVITAGAATVAVKIWDKLRGQK